MTDVKLTNGGDLKIYKSTKCIDKEICKVEIHHKGFSMYEPRRDSNGIKFYSHMYTTSVDTSQVDWQEVQELTKTTLEIINEFEEDEIDELVDIIIMKSSEEYSEWKSSNTVEDNNEILYAEV